ncbi:hypothetical protein [Corynebacterium aquatimens]|uniref:hypothetical protein n=1 Tax=Corynebacterium aquatimens TaxID=1190508 RepID=UPI0033142961
MNAAERLKELTRPTGEEDILPVNYPPPRVRVEPKQAVAASAVVLALVGGWAFTRPPSQPAQEPEWGQVAAATAVPEQVVVAVVGRLPTLG